MINRDSFEAGCPGCLSPYVRALPCGCWHPLFFPHTPEWLWPQVLPQLSSPSRLSQSFSPQDPLNIPSHVTMSAPQSLAEWNHCFGFPVNQMADPRLGRLSNPNLYSASCPCQLIPVPKPPSRDVGVQFHPETSDEIQQNSDETERAKSPDPQILKKPTLVLNNTQTSANDSPRHPMLWALESNNPAPNCDIPKRTKRLCALTQASSRIRECWANPALSPALPFDFHRRVADHLVDGHRTEVLSDLSHTRVYPHPLSHAWSASRHRQFNFER